MTDYFALLGFERRPWLEPDEVQSRFLALSSKAHPDRVHGSGAASVQTATDDFANLNSAAACLRDAKERVQHLLKLEGAVESATGQISPELTTLFSEIGQTCRQVDAFLVEKSKAASPMLQAQLFERGLDWSDRLSKLQSSVAALRENAEAQLRQISSLWPAEKNLERLKSIGHVLAMTRKWEAQLKERFGALAFP